MKVRSLMIIAVATLLLASCSSALDFLKGSQGASGTSIIWQGALAAAPASPELDWAYYDTVQRSAFVWDGGSWQLLAADGADGAAGTNGTNGTNGSAGVSIVWKGTFTDATVPASPGLNWAYYNSSQAKAYVFDGSAWQVLAADGTAGAQGVAGTPGLTGPQGLAWQAPRVSFMTGVDFMANGNGITVEGAIFPPRLNTSRDGYASNPSSGIAGCSALASMGAENSNYYFALAGNGAAISVSSDGGLSWTPATTVDTPYPGYTTIHSFAVGNSAWAAVGYCSTPPAAVILISTDKGITWTPPTSMPSGLATSLNSVAFGVDASGGALLAVGDEGVILDGSDGLNWTQVSPSLTTKNLSSLVWDGNSWMMAGNSPALPTAETVVFTSSDGAVSWTVALSYAGAMNYAGAPISQLAYGNGITVGLSTHSQTTITSWNPTTPALNYLDLIYTDLYFTADAGLSWIPAQWMSSKQPAGIIWDGVRFIVIFAPDPS